MQLTRDPALGLHWAQREGGMNFAPVTHLLLYTGSLRKALELMLKFEPLLSDERVFELVESEGKVAIRCRRLQTASAMMQTFWAAIGLAGLFRLIRFFCPQVRPDRVAFEHAAPEYSAEYVRYFGCEVSFEQPFTEIVLEQALLDAPSRMQDDGVHGALQGLAERRIQQLARPASYSLRIRDFLVQQERAYCVDMKTVADSLGVSIRTLRRRLAAEGSSYRAVENEALTIVATRLLREPQRSIQEVAHAMGFSEVSIFHRVFKSWTGLTPGAYRASLAAGPGAETSE
jgi:AraC-like DNA-binding protein